ncbi:MAG: hypothetical protein WCW35_13545 [Bacteroidota bacterium]
MNLSQHKITRAAFLFSMMIMLSAEVYSQATPQIQMFRDEPKGEIRWRKKGMLDGNLVRTSYGNNGEVSDWFNGAVAAPHGEWPKGSGHRSLDGLTLLIGSKIHHTDMLGRKVTITPIESSYREEMDKDQTTGLIWGLEPVPGYANPSSTSPGINIIKSTFPEQWPRSIFYDLYGTDESKIKEWDNFWYGYFGRGVSNAQLETYFVIDDSKDKEFANAPWGYYPISTDSARGGLGLRVEVRGFQWTHVLAEDIIFWHYDIINLADSVQDSTVFGFYADPSVGSKANDALFDRKLDLAYAWEPTGTGGLPDGYKTGYYGHSFLESPGNGTNVNGGGLGIDDDEDGMINERRDDGIDNDNDWDKFTDVNGDGIWSIDEPLNDDVGKDGVGPFDPQYTGKDDGEGDGFPTLGEPDFDKTDKDESDQIGLQSAYLGLLSDKTDNGVWPRNDPVIWKVMTGGFVDTSIKSANISMVFSSGIFPLLQNQRERFSIAILFGDDLNDIITNKITVQSIYDANYNFAQPPYTPTLTAVPGDKKVYLYWDNIAERSYDRFLKQFDFEGYLLYRSNEAEFQDIKVVTDSKGQAKFWKPIAQWDLIDTIKGPDPVGVNGAHFWRGEDNGLQHSYVDNAVVNGKKYYYALVSYDRGVIPNKVDSVYGPVGGLTPSECTKIISEDFNGTLKFTDINTAVVIPNAQSAGYIPPQVEGSTSILKGGGIGTGNVEIGIVNPAIVPEGNTYEIWFDSVGTWPKYNTKSFSVYRKLPGSSVKDTLIREASFTKATPVVVSIPFDGMSLTLYNDTSVTIDRELTGWAPGRFSNITMNPTVDVTNISKNIAYPGDYEIRFYNTMKDTGFLFQKSPYKRLDSTTLDAYYIKAPVPFTITNLTTGKRCKFLVLNMFGYNFSPNPFGYFDSIKIVDDYNGGSSFYISYNLSFSPPSMNPDFPVEGDRFILKTKKPFTRGDYFEVNTHSARVDKGIAKSELQKISVVPNPYVVAANWEPRNIYQSGRGDRKIDFIHLPAKCTIRIYTINGLLVKTLEKNSTAGDGSMSWNLISDDGMEVAYGLYIFHVDAENIGTHIGKFAVIK